MILERASGQPVHQLDLFMIGEEHCRRLLHDAAQEADIILVEGVMGLFDGDPSSADIAALFGLPVLAVIDASAMAQSFGALVHGLAGYRQDVRVEAVIANRVAGERHAEMLCASVRSPVRWLGALPRDPGLALPERHLGLLMAAEIEDLDQRIAAAAVALPIEAQALPPPVAFPAPRERGTLSPLLQGRRIAIARDACFAFIYADNLSLLRELGAELRFFSPLADEAMPECDALWLPGGYPELHARTLVARRKWQSDVRRHVARGKPLLAECGGMMVCTEALETADGVFPMLGLIPARAIMQNKLQGLGLQQVDLPTGQLRGHSFHYSRIETELAPLVRSRNPNGGRDEPVFRSGSILASYVHFHFRSDPPAVAALLGGD